MHHIFHYLNEREGKESALGLQRESHLFSVRELGN